MRALSAAVSGDPAGDLLVDELEAGAAADRLVAGLDDVAAAGHHLGAEARARAVVEHQVAERVGDEHLLARVAVADDRLDHLGRGRARGLVTGAHELGLARDGHLARRCEHGVLARVGQDGAEVDDRGAAGARADRGGDGVGRGREARLVDGVAVGVVGALAREQADGGAGLPAAAGLLDAPVLEPQPEALAVFDEHLGEVTAPAQRPLHGRTQQGGVEGCDVHQAPPVRESRTPAASVSSSTVEGSDRSSVRTAPSRRPSCTRGSAGAARPAAPPHETGDGAGRKDREGDGARPHRVSPSAGKASPRQVRRSKSSRPTAGRGPVTATAR